MPRIAHPRRRMIRAFGTLVHPSIAGQLSRLLAGHPDVRITSGWRSPWDNKRVGGGTNSRHMLGIAVDLVGPKNTLTHIRQEARSLGATEVLDEGDHTHVAWPRTWAA